MAGLYASCQRRDFTERFWLGPGRPGVHFSNDVRVTDIEYDALNYMRDFEQLTAFPGFLLAWQHDVAAGDEIDFCTMFPLTDLIRIASGFVTAGAAPRVNSAAVRQALTGITLSFCDMSKIHLLPEGHENKTCAPLHAKFDRIVRFLGSRTIQRHLGSLSCGFMFFFKGVIDVVLCIVNGRAADRVTACIAAVERFVCIHNSDGSLNNKYLGSSFDLLVEREER